MTTIYSNGAFFDEIWHPLGEDGELPLSGNVIVPLERFVATPETYLQSGRQIAVRIEPGEQVENLQPSLGKVSLVIVAFPKFSDGRGFSASRILREEFGYKGDIRATGDYLLDQIPLLRRCGVSSFEISKPEVINALKAGEWPEVTSYLQPVGTVEETPAGTRPWARRSMRSFSQAAE